MKEHCYQLHISGKVQGVYYRKSAQEEALRLNLSGWVRNEEDGSVRAEAQGAEDDLQKFIDWCQQGPVAARVENVAVEEIQPGNYESFRIIR